MKTVFQHIEHVKGKPHHIRKQVAFGVATFGTALIALVWLATSVGTGVFALKATPFPGSTGDGGSSPTGNNAEQLAGVGAASVLGNASGAARIEIVDTASSTLTGKKAEQTTIPF